MTFKFQPEENVSDPLNNKTGQGIELPFGFLYLVWRYGNPDFSELGADHPKYSGGWSINSDSVDTFREKSGMNAFNLPLAWKPATFKGDKENYNAYVSKRADMIVVTSRSRSESTDREGKINRIAPAYTKGMKTKTQYLCLLRCDDVAVPVVFSAQSYKQSSFRKAFDDFRESAKDFCKKILRPISPLLDYAWN
jgi:hypothetical protein